MRFPGLIGCVGLGLLVARPAPGAAASDPFDAPLLEGRPRVFLRRDGFEGLTVEGLRRAVAGEELRAFRSKWRARPMGRALEWMVGGGRADLEAAIAGLKRMDAASGSWSDRGLALVRLATLFDWLHDELDGATRAAVIRRIEKAADAGVDHIRRGRAPFFYSRTPGALAGVTIAGIALHGASPRAEGYLSLFREWGVPDHFRAYEWVDGAATGATYTLYYTFVDLPLICAAWWSATGQNPTDWIRREQGAWLDRIVRFYLWYLRPGFAFTDINDQSRGVWGTHDQFCQGLDIASYVTRSAHGRAWSRRWWARFGPSLYHSAYAHHAIFRDPTLAARPLTDLPRAELFGRESCGYGFFRSEWPGEGEPDTATHVFFRMGDPMNVHGGVAAGEFQIFRHAPLAVHGGRYSSYDSPPDQYHRNAVSANLVLFTMADDPRDRGDQLTRRGLKSDHRTWAEWLAIRERSGHDVARITSWEVGDDIARCRADLSRCVPGTKCREWTRELVWLDGKHLIVLDVVETASPGVRCQWQMHAASRPVVGERLVTILGEAPPDRWHDERLRPPRRRGRLFCRTLAPEAYRLVVQSGGEATLHDPSGEPRGAIEGSPFHRQHGGHVLQLSPTGRELRTVFVHVLTAVDEAVTRPPEARLARSGRDSVEVAVEGRSVRLSLTGTGTARAE